MRDRWSITDRPRKGAVRGGLTPLQLGELYAVAIQWQCDRRLAGRKELALARIRDAQCFEVEDHLPAR